MNLLDIGTEEFRLFDEQRRRFIPIAPRRLTSEEAAAANEYYARLKCPHLQWKKEDEQPVRIYAIRQ